MVECDVCVPEELQDYFSEMQPVFKNASITRDDIGPFMRQYAEEHDILTKPRVMLVCSFVVSRSYSPHHCYDGTSHMDSWWSECTKSSSMNLTPTFDGLASRFPQLGALEMKTTTRSSLPTQCNYSAIRPMGRRSPTSIDIVMSSTAPRSAHQRSSTTNGFDNWMSPMTRTK